MDLTHRFSVPASLDETWKAFSHIDRVANFFPGATITSVSGDDFSGVVKIKFGPASLAYEGSGSYVSRDSKAHTMVLKAAAADRRGNGVGNLTVTATFSRGAGATDVEVHSDLILNGRPTQLGRGVVSDVSDRLADQFVAGIAASFAEHGGKLPATEPPRPSAASGAAAASRHAASQPIPGRHSPGSAGPVSAGARIRIAAPANAARTDFDVVATLAPVLARRYGLALLGVVGLVVVIRLVRSGVRKSIRRRSAS